MGLLLSVVLLSACVTGTRNIQISPPDYVNEKTASGPIYIGSIEDSRNFEAKPRDPSTPSVNGDLASTPKEKLATLIGRQRNGYGAAMGDVALPQGSTVQDRIRELLTKGLESRGYTVVNDAGAAKKVSVDISQFWAWFSPGMWAVSFESNLQCKITFADGAQSKMFDVKGYGINKGQVASDANWELTYQRAFEDFLKNLDQVLDANGL